MLLSGNRHEQQQQLAEISDGYNEFNDFNAAELGWVEILRTWRIVQQAAWVGRRWTDPAFPRAFTWFDGPRYWPDHILQLAGTTGCPQRGSTYPASLKTKEN